MIQSMTGFGKAVIQLADKKIVVEIKTLNSKNLDLAMRLPAIFREKELEIRKIVAEKLERGKIDCLIYIESTSIDKTVQLNTTAIHYYLKELQTIVPQVTEKELITTVMRLPETYITSREELTTEQWKILQSLIYEALQDTQNFRKQEGAVIEQDFELRLQLIQNLLQAVHEYEPARLELLQTRLKSRLEEVITWELIDKNRFEQEMIFYIEKYDITEEKTRLQNHLNYFKQIMMQENANGRKLGFVAQEMGREINTLGSKANHSEIQKIVVQMKDELEKIKEQLLNIL